jgi:hypothetical protein
MFSALAELTMAETSLTVLGDIKIELTPFHLERGSNK